MRNASPGRRRGLALVGVLLVGVMLVTLGLGGHADRPSRLIASSAARTERGFAAVAADARGPISAALGRLEPGYRIVGLTASDPAQRLRARFSADGTTVSSDGARLGLALAGFGNGRDLHGIAPTAPRVEANRVSYAHGPLTEWWANGPLGLEQGFDVPSRPVGGTGPLTLSLALSGNLRARLDHGSVLLSGAAGAALRYGGLSASDSSGRALAARFALHGGRLLIEVDTQGASFPVRVDPFVQQAELTDGAGAVDDELGFTVAAGGGTVAVGAPSRAGPGAVFVFTEPSTGWTTTTTPRAVLTESATTGLGDSLAIDASGDTIVAGAVTQGTLSCIGCTPEGAVYVFTRPPSGVWVSSSAPAELSPNDVTAGHEVGGEVAIDASGDTIVAGAASHKVGSNDSQGAVYVWMRPATGGWKTTTNQSAELTAATGTGAGQAGDGLGSSVAISSTGSSVAAGARGREVGTNIDQGAVYAFIRPTTGWNAGAVHQTSFLTASDGAKDDTLGESVALTDSVIVAGAPGHGPSGQGAAYVFVKPAIGWLKSAMQNAELTAQLGYASDFLGASVATSTDGGMVLAGARGSLSLASPPAGVYEFLEPAAGWPSAASNLVLHESYELTPVAPSTGDGFGASVRLGGGTVVVGAPGQTIGTNTRQGAAFVFGFPSPAVKITTPASGVSYAQSASIKASYTCSVTGSTISSCSGPVAAGHAINTAIPGMHTFTVTANTVDGLQTSRTVSYTVLATPALSKLKQSHVRWRDGHARARIALDATAARGKPPVGTVFSFSLNEPARVAFTFTYKTGGRKVHGKCVAATAKNKRDRRCTRTAGTLSLSAVKGKDRVTFDGRLSGSKQLRAGSYSVSVIATNAARRSTKAKSLGFTIVK